MNSRFLRNGIVTLVLVVGTAALLYMFIFPDTKANTVPYSGAGSLLELVSQGKVSKVTQQGQSLEIVLTSTDPATGKAPVVTSAVPSELATNVQQDIDCQLRGARLHSGTHIGRSSAIGQRPVAQRAHHGAAAHVAHRRVALLHVPPGAGHQ